MLSVIRVKKEATLNRGTSKQIDRQELAVIIHSVSPLSITLNGGIVSPVSILKGKKCIVVNNSGFAGATRTGIGRHPI
jgi:hypothetical protein